MMIYAQDRCISALCNKVSENKSLFTTKIKEIKKISETIGNRYDDTNNAVPFCSLFKFCNEIVIEIKILEYMNHNCCASFSIYFLNIYITFKHVFSAAFGLMKI